MTVAVDVEVEMFTCAGKLRIDSTTLTTQGAQLNGVVVGAELGVVTFGSCARIVRAWRSAASSSTIVRQEDRNRTSVFMVRSVELIYVILTVAKLRPRRSDDITLSSTQHEGRAPL